MAFKQFEHKPGQRVTWFALDKDKFQAIFEDALNEMNLDSNDSSQNSTSGSSASKEDLPRIKIEKTENLHFQEEKTLEEIKREFEAETKMESIDEVALPKDLSVSSEHSATFSNIRCIPHKDQRHTDLMTNTRSPKRSLTPEVSKLQITHPLKRSHSATDLITNSSEILRDPIVPIANAIDDSEPIEAEEPNVGLEKVLIENKKNFVSIENILSRDNGYFTKRSSRPQFKSGESLNSSTLEFYNNLPKSTSITESLPTKCGWFGIDKKIFSGIVDTLSQIYFENFTRGELIGMNSTKFNLAAEDSRSIHNQVTRAVELHRQNSWYSNSSGCRKVSKAHELFSQNAHSRMFKERFPFSRPGLMSRCLLEHGRTLRRSSKIASRTSCGKGKECKRREKVLNSSCVSSTIGSPRKDGSSPQKRSCSPSNKPSGKESWIRVDKSLVNGMVDFLVGQLYPESEPSKKSEIKKETGSRNENHNTSDYVLSNDIRCSCKGENSTDSQTNSPSVKRVGGDRTNYSIGFLSKSESRGQKLSDAETGNMSNPSNDECNRSLDNKSQAWKSETVQKIDMSSDKSPSKGYSSPASYWNPGAGNTLKEAILT